MYCNRYLLFSRPITYSSRRLYQYNEDEFLVIMLCGLTTFFKITSLQGNEGMTMTEYYIL